MKLFWEKVGIKNNALHLAAMTTIKQINSKICFKFCQKVMFDWGLMHVLQSVPEIEATTFLSHFLLCNVFEPLPALYVAKLWLWAQNNTKSRYQGK